MHRGIVALINERKSDLMQISAAEDRASSVNVNFP